MSPRNPPSGRRRLPAFSFVLLAATGLVSAQNVVDATITVAPGVVDLGPGYTAEPARLYNGMLPGPVLRATVGDTLRVRVVNQLPESTTVHFHGQPNTVGMDGMEGISRPAIAPGQEFRYVLKNLHSGTYWFHPHSDTHHTQLDQGMAGVLIVDPPNPGLDPSYDYEQVVVLDDWNPANTGGTFAGHLLNGKTSLGQVPIAAQPGAILRLRFINASAVTNYVVAIDGHDMTVTHADGNRVQPVVVQAIPIGIGERYDVLVDCSNPGVWSIAASAITNRAATLVRGVLRYAGQTGPDPAAAYVPPNLSGGSLLGYAQLASYWPVATPITATPDRHYPVALGMQMGPGGMQWTINGEAYPVVTPMQVTEGDVVQFDLTTTTMGMNHFHPMHMHGVFVHLMGTAGGTTHPPIKDTVLVRPAGQPGSAWSVQWVADNPGRWLYHCHDMMHMMRGMMTLIDYVGDHDGDGIADADDMEPTRDVPVLTIADDAAAFAVGGAGALSVQWQPAQFVGYWAAPQELPLPVALPPLGELELPAASAVPLGLGFTSAAGTAALAYTVPALPALVGVRFALQAVAGTTLPGGLRLSPAQAFTIR